MIRKEHGAVVVSGIAINDFVRGITSPKQEAIRARRNRREMFREAVYTRTNNGFEIELPGLDALEESEEEISATEYNNVSVFFITSNVQPFVAGRAETGEFSVISDTVRCVCDEDDYDLSASVIKQKNFQFCSSVA